MIARATVAMLLALAAVFVAKRASAATRHAILAAGQLAALLIPLLGFVVPPVTMTVVEPHFARVAAPAAEAPAQQSRRNIPFHTIWLAGAVVVAALRTRSLAKMIGIARRAQRWHGAYLSDEIDQPATLGARVLLPMSATAWDDAQLHAVLLHERAHVERRDSILGLAGDALCAVYWFHPLAWLLARRARFERERACDETVLARGVRGSDYAAVLVAIARGAARHAPAMPMAQRSGLELRVRAILRDPLRRPRRGARAAVAAAALIAAPFVSALTPFILARPTAGEPDLLGDIIASPESERLDNVSSRAQRGIPRGGGFLAPLGMTPDSTLIAILQSLAAQDHRSAFDLVPDRARWALAQVRDGRLVEPLLNALNDNDWRIRAYAAWALGISGDRRATAPLLALLRDPVWRMRAMAAYALAAIGDPAAHAAMRDALGDRAWQVRVEAVRYLAVLRDPADRPLLRAMRDDRHVAVRGAAFEALP